MTLWMLPQFKIQKSSLYRRTHTIPNPVQRASFSTWQRASYTIEAAVVIPLLAGYLVTILFFFSILRIQCDVEEALYYTGKKLAAESSIVKSEELLFLSCEAYFRYYLSENDFIKTYVKNGLWGIYLWKSDFDGEDILLRAEYVIELPISFLGLGQIKLVNQNTFRKWSGEYQENTEGEYVYISPNGEVYHSDLSCRSIHLSIQEIEREKVSDIRGKDGQKYYECSHCSSKEITKERVYYTEYGTLYHYDIGCSALKRNVEKIAKEEVGERRPCSFCYK